MTVDNRVRSLKPRLVRVSMLAVLLVGAALLGAGCGGDAASTEGTTTTTALVVPISNDTCLGCHEDFAAKTANENQKVFAHDLHLKQRIACSECHTKAGHSGVPLPDRKTCDDCHGLQMPHPDDFGTSHGKEVLAEGTKKCEKCHNVYLHCQECHGLQMPHPEGWTQKHGEIARPEMDVCQRCHDKEFCLTCHPVEMPHPADWTSGHGTAVAADGSQSCTVCHKPEDCSACHGLAMPHPDDWGTTHPAAAKEKPDGCVLCHTQEDCDKCHQIHKTHGNGGGA